MTEYKVMPGYDFVQKIAASLGLKHTRRIIIDVGLDAAVTVYVEFLGDERLYNIDFGDLKIEITED